MFLPRGYDIYLSETIFVIPTLSKVLGRVPKYSKIVNLMADPILYNIKMGRPNRIPNKILRFLAGKVDAYVSVGPWKSLLRDLGINVPVIEIVSGVEDKLYDRLLKQSNKTFNHDIIFIGNLTPSRAEYKGLDIIFEGLDLVRKKYSDARLIISGQSQLSEEHTGIEYTGFVRDIAKELRKVSLAVNMGRGDTFPVGTIESMLAGVPTIVSNQTGTKIIADKADKSFVVDLNSNKLASKIIEYFKMSDKEKIALQKKFKKAALPYKRSLVIADFKGKWEDLVRTLGKKGPNA